jgi:predicted HAD superfamily Cof-like phosphohydrolase
MNKLILSALTFHKDTQMSKDWVKDINEMQSKYKTHDWIKDADINKLKAFLRFRIDFLEEELTETRNAQKVIDSEEIVDGLVDLCVVAIGTLDAFGVDPYKAWDSVLEANMAKEPGVKEARPNPLGLPDLMKPEGWTAPSHEGNHGILPTLKGG